MKKGLYYKLFLMLITLSTYAFAQEKNKTKEGEKLDMQINLKKVKYNDSLAIDFGKKLYYLISENKTDSVIDLFSTPQFEQRILSQIDIKGEDNASFFQERVHAKANEQAHNFNTILRDFQNSYFDFVFYRFDVFQESYSVLFRKYDEKNGLNYIEFRLGKENGKMVFNDVYNYFRGESMSSTLANDINYEMILNSDDPSHSKMREDILQYKKAENAYQNKDFVTSLEAFNNIKGDLKNEKQIMINKVFIATQLDEEKYQKALSELENQYSNDPTIGLTLMDYYMYKKDTPKVLSIFSVLENETHDNFLNYLKANYLAYVGKNEEAKKLYKQVLYQFPNFPPAYLQYVYLNLETQDYEDVTIGLKGLVNLGINAQSLINKLEQNKDDAQIQQFLESEEYKDWKSQNSNN